MLCGCKVTQLDSSSVTQCQRISSDGFERTPDAEGCIARDLVRGLARMFGLDGGFSFRHDVVPEVLDGLAETHCRLRD